MCQEPGCENLPGFTWPGGLPRHMREVHGQKAGKAKWPCPFETCNRSVGAGFSRKENLREHIRRVHRQAPPDESPVKVEPDLVSLTGSRKRHRPTDQGGEGFASDEQLSQDLKQEVKRLRRELREKDERLRRVEEQMAIKDERLRRVEQQLAVLTRGHG